MPATRSPRDWRVPVIFLALDNARPPPGAEDQHESCVGVSALAPQIAKAQNFQDVFGLQAVFALEQMKAYAAQTQELQKLIGETLQKLQHS